MAHLLVLELPGGNDADILYAALERGDQFTFVSGQLDHYTGQRGLDKILAQARALVEISPFDYDALEQSMLAIHLVQPFDAVLCLLDTRLIEASRLARALQLRFLNPQTTLLLRDKFHVRARLAECGIDQPAFALATSNAELKAAVEELGLPVLIKPVDGYGSQNIVLLRYPEDLDPLLTPLEDMLPSRTDYGLGVRANDHLLVERYMAGTVVGCDTLTHDGRHQLLGVNEKLYFEQPSFAIRGGCFKPHRPAFAQIERYVFSLLDAVGFDWGAAHVELMLTPKGPQLVEINARLVGAKIARLMGYALGRSVHRALIDTHLGLPWQSLPGEADRVAVTRWMVAQQSGVLERVELPDWDDPRIRCVEVLKAPGDAVRPPIDNADRIGYVMVCGPDQGEAEQLAQAYVAQCNCVLLPRIAR